MNKIFFLKPEEWSDVVLSCIKERLERADPLLMAVSYFTHKEIADQIIERIKLGKETKILLNANDLFRPQTIEETEVKVSAAVIKIIDELKKRENRGYCCCEIKTLWGNVSQYSVMHHKFIVSWNIDVCYGSMNFTHNSLKNNFENISVISDSNIVNSFLDEFDKLWKIASDLVIGYDGIRSFRCPSCWEENWIDFESYWAFCTICQKEFKITTY